MAGKCWKIAKGRYGVITPSGRRDIVSSRAEAKRLSGSSSTRSSGGNMARGGNRAFGNMGIKGVLTGTGLFSIIRMILGRFAPGIEATYGAPASLLGAGVAAKALDMTGKSLVAPGVIMLGSEFLSNLLAGGVRGVFAAPGKTKGYLYG